MKAREDIKGSSSCDESDLWEVQACRGKEGPCPYALVSWLRLKADIDAELRAPVWGKFPSELWRGQ